MKFTHLFLWSKGKRTSRWLSIGHRSPFSISRSMGFGITANYEPTSHYLDREKKAVGSLRDYLHKTFMNDQLSTRLDFSILGKQ